MRSCARLCLDSKYEGGKLTRGLFSWTSPLCLDSKYEGGKLPKASSSGSPPLCLDSKYEGGKLQRGNGSLATVLCLDSKYEGGKLGPTRAPRSPRFALIPNTRVANYKLSLTNALPALP